MEDFNKTVIEKFRSNHGKVPGDFEESTILLLTTKGAKSGKEYTSPLVYTMDGDKYVIIASKGGADTNPGWFYNLQANPEVTIEVGADKFKVKAEVTNEETRKRLFDKHAEQYPNFLDYQKGTSRVIPAVLLEKIN
jgi:deazaflavin-dependent oxidoreductase (nitroreductase family)